MSLQIGQLSYFEAPIKLNINKDETQLTLIIFYLSISKFFNNSH